MSASFTDGPEGLPPIDRETDSYRFLVQAGELTNLSAERERVAFWTSAIALALGRNPLSRAIPAFRFSAIGFLDPATERRSFGVVAFVDPDVARTLQRRRRYGGRRTPLTYIQAEGISFPVFVRGYREHRHASPCQPVGGTASCWAISRRGTYPVGPAILTAGHVASGNPDDSTPRIGTSVRMRSGQAGHVVDVGTPGMDLALVDVGDHPHGNPIPTARALPWDTVTVECVPPFAAQVRFVTDTQGIFASPLMLVRLLLDKSGMPGDSGALVTGSDGAAVGMYLGAAADPTGLTLGLSADIHQAAQLLDMELIE